MAGIPISGALVQKYGFLALSIYAGVSLLVGGLLLGVARGAQSMELRAVVWVLIRRVFGEDGDVGGVVVVSE